MNQRQSRLEPPGASPAAVPSANPDIRLEQGDSFELMRTLPAASFDLAIVDPPYGASSTAPVALPKNHGMKGFGGEWKLAAHEWDMLSGLDSFRMTVAWLTEVKRLVKPEGSFWIYGTYHNIAIANVACQILGLEIINEVIWYKRNAFPNLAGRRLTASHENLIWAHTGAKRKYRFNYDATKAASYAEDRLKAAGKQMRTVWDIPNNKESRELMFGSHPTQKPLRLIKRILQVSAFRQAKVLVPFVGSGSELVACAEEGIDATGFEIDSTFVGIARNRVKAALANAPLHEVKFG